ncbi:hypothetical protein HY837_02545 [archaeon]|nr:hypothetical protein [archaeon]
MRLVVDTNRIIAALIKNSTSRKIITYFNAELLMLNFSETEIDKYRDEIIEKAKIREEEFEVILNALKEKLIVLNDDLILTKFDEAKKIMDSIDPSDTPFIAAALATNSDIWSDDKHFNLQKRIKIWSTRDLVEII